MTTTLEPALTSPDNTKADARVTGPAVEIVIPVYNEEHDLAPSVRRLHDYLVSCFPLSFAITIADNASTDHTWHIAQALADDLPEVRAEHLDEKGRGRALHSVWSKSDAFVVCYMDVDLSTDLAALLPLVAPLISGHSDVAIGTRLSGSARVVRGPKRELISRCYNLLLRTTLATKFSDAQCGFKALRADRARELLPLVRDRAWFFDTELLVLAERAGMRIHEIPVDWIDDADSRVDILSTAVADIRGIARLARGFAGEALRFCGVGAVSTLAYLVLYLLLRNEMAASAANAIALLVTAIANTAANRGYTFGLHGKQGRWRHQVRGLVAFAIGLALSTGALAVLHAIAPTAGRVVELLALVVANLASTAVRFVLFKSWVFERSSAQPKNAASLPRKEI
jgi:putative flippase GtrA